MAVSLGLAVWLAVAASDDATAPVLALGLAGSAAAAGALFRPVALGPSLAASAAAYAVLLAIDEPPLDSRAAGVAAALLAVGELTGWSRELASATTDEPGGAWRRPMWIAAAVAGATGLAWVLVAMVDIARVEGLAVEAVGALAALAVVFLLVRRSAA